MKKIATRGLPVLLLCLFLLLLASCSGGGAKTPEAAESPTAAPAEEPAEAPAEEPAEAPAADTYSVTFDLNYDGAPAAEVRQVEAENAAEPPADPARDGFAFTGWYTDAEGTAEADFEVAILADAVFYAGWEKTGVTVTFDPNYDGAEPTAVELNMGETVSTPVSPVREGFLFTAWNTDAEGTTPYDFSREVTGDITLYASWAEDDGNNFRVTFEWNIDDKGTYDTVAVKKLGFAAAPELKLDGLYLEGWYTDAECTERFDFAATRVKEDVTLYANWLKEAVFEAEYTDLTGLEGMGYSGNASGVNMIEDGTEREASNGYYVGWLYNEGLTLTFRLTSDAAVDNARLALRLSAEYYDITLTDSSYTVAVNGQKVSYSDIEFAGAADSVLPFRTFLLDGGVSLQEGENVVTLSVTNTEKKTGTIYATAPMVDSLIVYSGANVAWAEGFPKTDNIR